MTLATYPSSEGSCYL